jgi:hypothetical protein
MRGGHVRQRPPAVSYFTDALAGRQPPDVRQDEQAAHAETPPAQKSGAIAGGACASECVMLQWRRMGSQRAGGRAQERPTRHSEDVACHGSLSTIFC